MNKKWVELFEKVIGRKPTPEEFIAGRDSGFDFKAIKSIAGVAIDQVASEAEPVSEAGMVPERETVLATETVPEAGMVPERETISDKEENL